MKRLLLLLACILGFSHSAFSQAAFVQSCQGHWTTGTTYTAVCTPTAAHHLIVAGVFVVAASASAEFSSFGCDGTDTYTPLDSHSDVAPGANLAVDIRTYYVKDASAATVTCTVTTVDGIAVDSGTLELREYSGTDLSSPLDVHANFNPQSNIGTGADAIASSSVTTGFDGEAIVAFMFSDRGGVVNYTPGTTGGGYTTRATYVTSMGIGEDQIWGSHGAITATATQDYSDALTDTYINIAAFKAAGGGGGTPLAGALMLLGAGL